MKLKYTLFSIPLALWACGPDVSAPTQTGPGQGLSLRFADGARLQDAQIRRAVSPAGAGAIMRLDPVQGRPPAPPQARLVRWDRRQRVLADFEGELFFYREVPFSGPSRLFKVRVTGGVLLAEEVFEPVGKIWFPVEEEDRVVGGEGLRAPVSLRSGERNIFVQPDDCRLRFEHGVYSCTLDASTPTSMYIPSALAAGDPAPVTLACLEACPNPKPSVKASEMFMEQPKQAYLQDPESRHVKYTYNSADLQLLYGDDEIRAPAAMDGKVMSGFMFEHHPENFEAMACDLDEDGLDQESCAWRPLPTFYTYATDYSLPIRGLIEP